MIIECPNCKKKFELPSNLIPERGRLLQCSACSTKWHFITEAKNTVKEKEPEKVIKKTEFPIEKDEKIEIEETPVNKKKVKSSFKIKTNDKIKIFNLNFIIFKYIYIFKSNIFHYC